MVSLLVSDFHLATPEFDRLDVKSALELWRIELVERPVRTVRTTLWAIADSSAPEVADTFYTQLTPGRQQPDPAQADEALHQAIRCLRRTNPGDPLLWASYIHLVT